MRIAVFTRIFPVLSETFIINQIVGLIKLGVEVEIITNEVSNSGVMHAAVEEYSLLRRIKCVGLPASRNKLLRLILSAFNSLVLILKGRMGELLSVLFDKYLTISQKLNLISALIKIKDKPIPYDNVICHFGDNGYYVCKMRELGCISGPISTVFHGFEVSSYDAIKKYLPQYKRLFVEGDLMLPISEYWKAQLIKWGCDVSKIKVHRMGVDVNNFEMKPLSSCLSSPLKVVQVGRLTEKKAILDSISAIALASKEISIEFIIIGGGDLYESAKDLIESLDAGAYIHLLGPQPQDVVKQYLNAADIFLLPSVRAKNGDMEGIPVALMESMAKGVITVSTYHSGIPELIENDVSGFLVEEHNITDLVNCLVKVQGLSIERLTDIRAKARSVCVDEFNNDILNRKILQLIKRDDH